MKDSMPSKVMMRFFRWFCDPELVTYVEGDLIELYHHSKRTKARWKADWIVFLEIIKLLRPSIIKNFEGTKKLNYYGMFKHNLKISYRNLWRRKSYAFINIGGLVLGLSIVILISLWIQDELTYDVRNDYLSQAARVMQKQTVNEEVITAKAIPFPLHVALEKEYGDDFEAIIPATWFGDYNLSKDNKAIVVRGGFMGDRAPDLMSLEMISGDRKELTQETSILISQSTAKALFGEHEPTGKTITVHGEVDLNVAGVFKDISEKSSFHRVQFIGNWDFYVAIMDWIDQTAWDDNSYQLFALIGEHAEMDVVSEKIKRVKFNNTPPEQRIYDSKVFLHPMKDWHLRSSWENGVQQGGAIRYVWWFGIIGGFILLLACVNFMNLSTAQSIKRAKEVGIRKAIGTGRGQLAFQFLTESMLIAFIAFLIASLIAFLALPYFNYLSDKQIEIPFASFSYWASGFGFAIVTGLISGSYPAMYLSSFNAIQALKGTFQSALSAVMFRKILVIFQFTVSVTLIIGTTIISQQIKHATSRPLGYDNDGTISIEMTSPAHYSKSEVFKNELLKSGVAINFTASSAPLTETWNIRDDISWEGMDQNISPRFCTFHINHSYGKTINWEIVQGRDFTDALASDSSAMIINEAAMTYMQLEDPINKKISWFKDFHIIGVVKDLLVESPFTKIEPAVYVINSGDLINFMLVKLNPEVPTLTAISEVESIFESTIPNTPFDFNFVSDVHNKKFNEINRIASICQVCAVLAILISCLGLFGLASFMVEQRSKEISIRKVLGAPIFTLWRLLSSEFVILVGISCLIAVPVALYGSQLWLDNYEYRTPLHWWVFLFASLVTMLITVLTISFRSLKVAKANPAEVLKDE
ncbi:MAG: ABC transporter permease [Ekhidna sp.]|nr:ABC transporter permease [Ekhidna sp.]